MNRETFEIPESLNRVSVYLVLDNNGKYKRIGKTKSPLAIESKKNIGDKHVYYPVPDDKDIIDYLNELIIEFNPELNTRLIDCYTLNQAYYYLSINEIKNTGKDFIEDYCNILGYEIYNYKYKNWVRKRLVDEIIHYQNEYKDFCQYRISNRYDK